ncbi:transmembrane protein [Tieghemostelium lacteum]|uniref:Transmembrane protein n=1 Tax=Tieghemostelium lacteum TaxID=361077 RepID=A0A152AA12_TIELA|nr:transmembrane protein [Tieghemostelium lacteum]|eukprot:KYR03063.1 transmembrane protein [Tieghemostelium lacteum]
MKFIILALLYIVCSLNANEESFLHNAVGAADEPFGIETKLNVVLVGLQGDGGYNYILNAQIFNELLQDSYPIHRPHSIDKSKYLILDDYINDHSRHKKDKEQDFKSMLVHNDLKYNVKSLPTSFLQSLETQMIDGLRLKNGNTYKLSIEHMETFFESQLPLHNVDIQEFTIVFLNPSRARLFGGNEQMNYEYEFQGKVCGPTWISSGRYVIVDLSAKGLAYGSTIHKSNEELISEGSVTPDSLPRLIEYFLKEGQQGTAVRGESPIELQAHMTAIVIQSIQYIFCQDSKYDYIPIFQKVLIPILIFKDHFEGASRFVEETSLDLSVIKREANRLFPFSDVSVIVGEHSLHDHKHIAMALSKSIQSHTSFELNPATKTYHPYTKTFVDSKELLMKLKKEDDILASGLIGDHVTPIPLDIAKGGSTTKGGANLQKTKILPVYVFSLDSQPDLFIDRYQIYAANQEAVVVLQSRITTKDYDNIYYTDNVTVDIDTKHLNRYIIAGLANSQGAMGPTFRFSPEHFRLVNNYLWSFGQHPFGYFGNSSAISQLFVDCIVRNTIVTTLQASDYSLNLAFNKIQEFSQRYLVNSFGYDLDEVPTGMFLIDRLYHRPPSKIPILKGIIQRLHSELEDIASRTHEALGYNLNNRKKHEISSNLLLISSRSSGFLEYVTQELQKAESELLCCAIKSNPIPLIEDSPRNYKILYYLLFLFLVLVFACVFINKRLN